MGQNKIKKIMKSVENAWTAASLAEDGETSAAQSLMRESRRVLLALNAGQIDLKTLKYALNTARRIKASLDILLVGTADVSSDVALNSFLTELSNAGISYQLIRRTGCLKRQIIDYTNREKEILFAVIESPVSLDAECISENEELSDLWRSLSCPLVVVMDGARA
jgi:hypothetical protein